MTGSCGKKTDSVNLPPLVQEVAAVDGPAEVVAAQQKWDDFAAALGIGNNQAGDTAALKSQLATPSSYLSPVRAAAYGALVSSIGQGFAQKAYATRCASISSVASLGTAKTIDPVAGTATDYAAAGLYLMTYQLQADGTGTAETTARKGFLVIPTTASATSPLAAYAHGGDFGLGYPEIAAAFGAYQGNHIIVAPSFPGQPLCKANTSSSSRSCDSSGELAAAAATGAAYDADADELLGMYDCVARATLSLADAPMVSSSGAATGETLSQILGARVKRHGAGTFASIPQGLIVGSSTGSLVASIALAKTGAALSAIATATAANPLGAGYKYPSYFSCAAQVSAPASFAFAEYRLMLEQWVKGRLLSTNFAAFPGMKNLAGSFDEYRAGTSDATTAISVITRRDAPLLSPLIVAALRGWVTYSTGSSNGSKGAYLAMHGLYDSVVPISQAQIGYNVLLGAATNTALVSGTDLTKSPGLSLTARAFSPATTYIENSRLKTGYLQHGDAAFFDSTAMIPGDLISATVTGSTLSDATAEAGANALAKAIFATDSPSAAQLKAARGYVLSGTLQTTMPTPTDGVDGTGAATIHLLESTLSPALTFKAWREGACAKALSGS